MQNRYLVSGRFLWLNGCFGFISGKIVFFVDVGQRKWNLLKSLKNYLFMVTKENIQNKKGLFSNKTDLLLSFKRISYQIFTLSLFGLYILSLCLIPKAS